MNDAEFERVFGEQGVDDGAGSHDTVAGFFSAIEDAYPEQPTSALEERHVAAMIGTARAMDAAVAANKLIAGAASASKARSRVIARLAAHGWSTVMAAVAVLLFAFGGAAYAGVLPSSLQQATSELAARVGIHLPTPLAGGNGRATGLHRVSDEKYGGGWSPGGSRASGEATAGAGAVTNTGGSVTATSGAGGSHAATGSAAVKAAKGASTRAAAKKSGTEKAAKSPKSAKKTAKSKKPKKPSANSSSGGGSQNSAGNDNGGGNGNSANSNSGGNGGGSGGSNGNGGGNDK